MGKFKAIVTLIASICLVHWFGHGVYAQGGSSDNDPVFAQAVGLHQSGDVQGAIKLYKEILTRQPDRADVLSNLGAAYSHEGRYLDAIDQYKRALILDSKNDITRFNLALAYYKATWFKEATQEFAAYIASVPDSEPRRYQAMLLQADCQVRLGEYQKAIDSLGPIEALHRDDRSFVYILGSALISAGQIDRGQTLIDHVFRQEDSAEGHLLIGSILLLADNGEGAMKELDRAIQLNPKLPSVHVWYGRALMRMGDAEKAMTEYRTELAANPNDFDANLYLGVLLKRDKLLDESLKYLTHTLELRPRNAYAQYQLGALYVNLGKPEEAKPLLEGVVKEHPDFIETRVLLASVYYRLNRKEDGDRERAMVQKLTNEEQAQQPGVKGSTKSKLGSDVTELPASADPKNPIKP